MKKLIKPLIILLLILIALYAYMRYYEPSRFKVKEYAIIDEELPDNYNGLKIIHFGDILYGRTINIKQLDKIVNEINILKPDIVIYTGNLYEDDINISKNEEEKISNSLNKINTTIGKYAISGNNDTKDYQEIMDNAGFNLIDNKEELITYKGITPIYISNNFDDIKEGYYIGVIHKPDNIDKINKDGLNLVLAGHSLNGQIRIPFYGALMKTNGAKKYSDDYYEVGNTKLYITNGIGTRKVSLRFNNIPSFNLYRLSNY